MLKKDLVVMYSLAGDVNSLIDKCVQPFIGYRKFGDSLRIISSTGTADGLTRGVAGSDGTDGGDVVVAGVVCRRGSLERWNSPLEA